MPNKMERFSESARRALSLAQAAAISRNSAAIDSDHLLLALVNQESGGAAQVLLDAGLDAASIEKLARGMDSAKVGGFAQIDLSDDCKRALERAVDEARRWTTISSAASICFWACCACRIAKPAKSCGSSMSKATRSAAASSRSRRRGPARPRPCHRLGSAARPVTTIIFCCA